MKLSKKTTCEWRHGLPDDTWHLPLQLVAAGPAAFTYGGTLGRP
jgi:hypothetical protein